MYNAMDEGAIVYLPIYEPGAYSMDVQFTVDLMKKHHISWPRVEHSDSIATLGCVPDGMERGFRHAISEMIAWLTADNGLPPQVAHVMHGTGSGLRDPGAGALRRHLLDHRRIDSARQGEAARYEKQCSAARQSRPPRLPPSPELRRSRSGPAARSPDRS